MGKKISRVASYLPSLNLTEYNLPENLANVANFFLDSYFAKIDQRALESIKDSGPPIPSNLDSHIRELWLGCEIHKAVTLNQVHSAYLKAQNAWAFTRLFNNFVGEGGTYEIVPFLDGYQYKDFLKNDYTYKIQSEQLTIALGVKVTLPVFGTFFIRRVSDNKQMVVNIDLCYDRMGCEFRVQVNPEDQIVAEQFFVDLANSIAINDIYRNKCLTFEKGILGFQEIRNTTWSDVIIKPELRDRIRANSVDVLKNIEELTNIGFPARRNSILISPPGMAKTTMFRATSNELDGQVTRIWCTGKSIDYADHVEALFEAARGLAPCIIFIEDMDLFGSERTSYGGQNYILNEFLAQLDGTSDNNGVVVMASTNDFLSMDEALINRPGRFNDKVIIPLPDSEERNAMLVKFFLSHNARKGGTISEDSWKNLIELTEGFTGDYIREVVNSAVLYAVAAGRCVGKTVILEADDLNKAGIRAIENNQIGNRAKKHIDSQKSDPETV